MSRILRRPMFRGGGKVNSYGTGIAARLVRGYKGGGQFGGGIFYANRMADGRFGFQAPVMFNAAEMTMPASGSITKGLDLLARNKAINWMLTNEENPNKDLLNARIEEIGDLMQKEADATNQLVN